VTQGQTNHDVGSMARRGAECLLCEANQGIHRPARFTAAQSRDKGHTVAWFPICEGHADGWNEGGDWNAPVIPL
jgi:hypothetical protein